MNYSSYLSPYTRGKKTLALSQREPGVLLCWADGLWQKHQLKCKAGKKTGGRRFLYIINI